MNITNKPIKHISALSVYVSVISLMLFTKQVFAFKNKISINLWNINLFILLFLTIGHAVSYLHYEELVIYFGVVWQALVVIDFIALLFLVMQNSRKGNIDAGIFRVGFVLYLIICSYELIQYIFFSIVPTMYKWGILIFVASLVLILGRRFSEAHEKLVDYSKELVSKNDALNIALKELKQSKEQIENLNISLELRVSERTRELKEAMERLVQTQEQLVQSEKMAALGGLVAGIAHEINTPIGIGVTAASHLDKESCEIEKLYKDNKIKKQDFESYINITRELTDVIVTNLRNASELIKSFKKVAVDQSNEEKRSFNVKEYIKEIVLSLSPELKKTKHRLTAKCPDDLELEGYPGALSQVITNLVMNSLNHAYDVSQQGNISIEIKKEQDNIVLRYADYGKGIESDHLSKIYEPFFTTKRNSGNNGLGLNILYNIITQKFRGTVKCNSQLNSGTEFLINIPII